MMSKREKHYIVSEVAALCGCSTQDIYSALKDGTLIGHKCASGKWLIPKGQDMAFNKLKAIDNSYLSARVEPNKLTEPTIKYIADEDHYSEVFARMNQVKRSLKLTSADLKNFNIYLDKSSESPIKLCEFLLMLVNRGIKVQIICMKPFYFYNYCEDNLPELLENENIEIRQCDHIHMKVFIFDDECAYIGSANLTGAAIGRRSSNKRNHEAGILVQNCQVFEDAFNHFNRVWDDPEVLKASWKRFKKQASEYRKKYQD